MVKKRANQKLKDILDSDDELPTEYIDSPFVPAYLNDNRFEYIEEKKVNKKQNKQKKVDNEQNKQKKERSVHHIRGSSKGGLSNGGTVAAYGYFKIQDTFCFKSIEPNIDKKTQQWLYNFLMIKDLNASYTFLTTCLVPSYGTDFSSGNRISFRGCNENIWKCLVVASK